MANESFFTLMRRVASMKERNALSKECLSLFNQICSYVEECPFSKSQYTKFLCKNWDCVPNVIKQKWDIKTGSDKSLSTWQTQVSVASQQLFGLFSGFCVEAFDSANDNDENIMSIRNSLGLALEALGSEDMFASDIFISEVCNFFEDTSYKEFSIDECGEELKALKVLMKQNIFDYLDKINPEKLKYILGVLNTPITSNKYRSVCRDKLLILQQLNLLSPSWSELKPKVNIIEKVVTKEVPETQRFKMGITREMADILDSRLSKPLTEQESRVDCSSSVYAEGISFLADRLYFMTPEGFKEILDKTNGLLLSQVVNGQYQGYKTKYRDTTELNEAERSFIK